MKTYLVSLTRSDTPSQYPVGLRAETLSDAIIAIVERSYKYQPSQGPAAFCMVSVHQMGDGENTRS